MAMKGLRQYHSKPHRLPGKRWKACGVKCKEMNLFPVTSTIHLSLAMELSPEVRQYPPYPAPQSSITASLLIYPLGGSLMGKRVGLDLQKEPLSTGHAACPLHLQLQRAVLSAHNNRTNWGSCSSWTTFHNPRTSITVEAGAASHSWAEDHTCAHGGWFEVSCLGLISLAKKTGETGNVILLVA